MGSRNSNRAALSRRDFCTALDSAKQREAALAEYKSKCDPSSECKVSFVVCTWMVDLHMDGGIAQRIFAREETFAPSEHVRLGRRVGARLRSAFGRSVLVFDVGPNVWLRYPCGASGLGIRESSPSQSRCARSTSICLETAFSPWAAPWSTSIELRGKRTVRRYGRWPRRVSSSVKRYGFRTDRSRRLVKVWPLLWFVQNVWPALFVAHGRGRWPCGDAVLSGIRCALCLSAEV